MSVDKVIYEEVFAPWFVPLVFYLPCFYKYGIKIVSTTTGSGASTVMTFGYGMRGPGGLTAHTVSLNKIDKESIQVGTATAKDNFMSFGGWGIRMGYSCGKLTWAYNACNGPYLEFDEIDEMGGKTTRYRIVSKDVDKVASILRGQVMTKDDDEKGGQESNPLLVTGVKG